MIANFPCRWVGTLGALCQLAGVPPALSQTRPPGAWDPAALRADAEQLRAHVRAVEQAFTDETRRAALAAVDVLRASVDTISPVAFDLAVARILALADNGHTGAGAFQRAARYPRVGLRMVPFGTALHVLRARPALPGLPGARLVAVDGHDMNTIRRAAHTLAGGTEAFRDRFLPVLAESPEQLHALGLARSPREASYRFAREDGTIVERTLHAEALSPARVPVFRWLFPEPVPADTTPWLQVAPPGMPWSLRDAEARFRIRHDPGDRLAVVDLRQNLTTESWNITTFLRAAHDSLRQWRPDWIVLDMRLNGGGNLNTTRFFARSLPALAGKRVFVLTSPWTFSAAIATVGYLKQAAPEKVVIVGEAPGDRLEFWAEGRPVTLSNTGIILSVARERHDYANGCRAYRDCHEAVVREPIAVPSLAPEIDAPWSFDAYRRGRDPAMDAVMAAIRGEALPSSSRPGR